MEIETWFRSNTWPTLGVELELQLVDAGTMELTSAIVPVLKSLPGELRGSVKPEFMQCYVEINTGVCRTVDDVAADLAEKLRAVERAAADQRARLFWGGTHPFSRWQDQRITPDDRYYKLAALLRETVVRPVTFGLHVHVGVDSGDTAIRTIGRLRRYLPLLLALSANSPFWHGRRTGHHAHRIEVLEGFPTGGLPPRMRTWEQYLRLVERLRSGGFIESTHDLWWDARPNAENGTVEVRICDMPADLPSVLRLTALIQCLVHRLSLQASRELGDSECRSLIIRQNRWRACRFGMGAELVDPVTLEAVPVLRAVEGLTTRLEPAAVALGCPEYLAELHASASRPVGSERQVSLYEETHDLRAVVRRLADESSRAVTGLAPETQTVPAPPSCVSFAPFRLDVAAGLPVA
jgi:carboxylate-amine ligase